MSKVETEQQNSNSKLKFGDVAKFFGLPLTDAADTLGVSNSTLKKICQDNGLVRWPYRKFLLGKSIEDIIKEAVLERKMEAAELLKPTKDGHDDATKNAVSTVGSTLQHKNPVHEISKARGITHQPGNKNIQTASLAIIDEFRYGFPADGLSRTSSEWWGNNATTDNKDTHIKEGEDDEVIEQRDSDKLLQNSSSNGEIYGRSGTDETDTPPKLTGTALLSAVRKRSVEEGKKALKLRVHHLSGVNKPGKREKLLLHGIFGSWVPKEWTDGFPEIS